MAGKNRLQQQPQSNPRDKYVSYDKFNEKACYWYFGSRAVYSWFGKA